MANTSAARAEEAAAAYHPQQALTPSSPLEIAAIRLELALAGLEQALAAQAQQAPAAPAPGLAAENTALRARLAKLEQRHARLQRIARAAADKIDEAAQRIAPELPLAH